MANDIVYRPDWNVASVDAASTIAGGYLRGSEMPVARSIPDDLPSALKSRWSEKEAGGLGYRLAIAQDAASTVLGRLTEESRADLVAAVDSLPEGVRAVVYAELGEGVSGHVRDASPADVSAFAASEIGHQLVSEWGGRAPKRVATFNKRADRMLDSMTDEGVGYFMARFTTLDVEQAKAFIRELGK
ncbi:hypothetical protein LJR235_002378 [Pararhizobium sp. LjRoot235]|uniref:hypothetical protein n=1 Tax=Pararhizobium sp. LjRoot235 TaxID=3342291 RepID=UPI003ECF11CB